METKITKQIAGLLYGFGYQLQDDSGRPLKIVGVTDDYIICEVDIKGKIYPCYVDYERIGSTYKILAREMDLTKPIEGVGIPIVELAIIAGFNIDNGYEVSDIRNSIIFNSFDGYRDFSFSDENFGSSEYDEKVSYMREWKVKNQLALFNWLYTHHFNFFPEGTTTNLI